MVSHQGSLSAGWSHIRMVSHHNGLTSGWSRITMVSHQNGLTSGWSFTMSCDGGNQEGGVGGGWKLYMHSPKSL